MQRPPTENEVPAQRDVLLSAVGGDGEDGHTGGHGEPGMAGSEGAPATREMDATVSNQIPCEACNCERVCILKLTRS